MSSTFARRSTISSTTGASSCTRFGLNAPLISARFRTCSGGSIMLTLGKTESCFVMRCSGVVPRAAAEYDSLSDDCSQMSWKRDSAQQSNSSQ